MRISRHDVAIMLLQEMYLTNTINYGAGEAIEGEEPARITERYRSMQFDDNRDRTQLEVRNSDVENPFKMDLSQPNAVSTWAAILHSLRYSHFRLLDDEFREMCCRHDPNRYFVARADESYVMAIVQEGQPVADELLDWHRITDSDKALLKQAMQDAFGQYAQSAERRKVRIPKLSNETLTDAIHLVGGIHRINLRVLYFKRAMSKYPQFSNRFGWDGKPRVDSFLKRAGCTIPEYIEVDGASTGYVDTYLTAVSKTILFGAVERNIADPEKGIVLDVMPIIIGDGGTGKSTLLETIADRGRLHAGAGPIASSRSSNARSPAHHFFDPLKSKLIGELVECTQMRHNSIEELKGFISQSKGEYADLHKETEMHPLTAVLVGTTNRRDVLKDGNGNRRFAPVEMMGEQEQMENHIVQVKDWEDYEIEQLWAESYYRVNAGESWRDDWRNNPDNILVQKVYCNDALEEPEYIPLLCDLIEKRLSEQEHHMDIERMSVVPGVPTAEIHRDFLDMYHSSARSEHLEIAYKAVCNDSRNREQNRFGYYIRSVRYYDGRKPQKCFCRPPQASRRK